MTSPTRQKFRFICLLFICFTWLFPAKAFAAYFFTVDSARIQSALLMYFPLREYRAAARLTLSEPMVILKQDADKLQLDISVLASIPGDGRKRGQVVADVGLHYKPSTGELFLADPKIRGFAMKGITDESRKTFRASLSDILIKTLPLVRIHQVREQDLNHSLSMSNMKSMRVEDGRIRVAIGFD
ncbi:hypothetical protein MNBD_GAMMA20-243 [hydrothermal vent metagenome]|uniref:DUF1439 domain-containing protein n=1 Tax=hydrothermal vent metagenome TaxID=652676 RepID=A0A3B1A954_9ZZZZ